LELLRHVSRRTNTRENAGPLSRPLRPLIGSACENDLWASTFSLSFSGLGYSNQVDRIVSIGWQVVTVALKPTSKTL
jgi:hypothetical protein